MGSTSDSWFSRGWWTFTGLLQRMHLAMGQEHGHKLWTCKRSQAGFGFEWETFRNNPPYYSYYIYIYLYIFIYRYIYTIYDTRFQRGEVVWFRCFSFAICACSIQHGKLPYLALIARTWTNMSMDVGPFWGRYLPNVGSLAFGHWPSCLPNYPIHRLCDIPQVGHWASPAAKV